MRLTESRIVDDAFHGELKIRTEDEPGLIEVSGDEVPTVVIRRAEGAGRDRFVPIGSRVAAELSLTIDGEPAELLPGKGKWTRGSYTVDVHSGPVHYRLKPDSVATSKLIRDGVKLATLSMDDEDGSFLVHWLVTKNESVPADATLGHALSAAFRTGALGLFSLLANGAEVAGPG